MKRIRKNKYIAAKRKGLHNPKKKNYAASLYVSINKINQSVYFSIKYIAKDGDEMKKRRPV